MSHATDQPDLPAPPDPSDALDDEWGEHPSGRWRPRVVLLVLLALSLSFLGGVEVQHRLGVSASSETAAAGLPAGFDPSSLPAGMPGLPGGQTAVSGTGAETSGDDAGSEETLLIGTVVSVAGNRWTVEDIGGATHVVVVGEDTRVSRTRDVERGTVRAGDAVTVSGTPTSGDQGASGLSATSVTLR